MYAALRVASHLDYRLVIRMNRTKIELWLRLYRVSEVVLSSRSSGRMKASVCPPPAAAQTSARLTS